MPDTKPSTQEGQVITDQHLRGKEELEASRIAELTPAEKVIEKKLVRRIDWIILPLILIIYLLNWIDRSVHPKPLTSESTQD